MKCTIPEISWHNRDPVLSVDMQLNKSGEFYRLASGGTDSHVLIWLLSVEKDGVASLECAADLTRHTKPVNCVRFSPSGELLASGDDESCIIIWKMKTSGDPVEFPSGEEDNFKEQWLSLKVLRGHLQDVYDLSWSSDSKNLISGSVDNTAILWEISSGKNLGILGEHKGFVQGVAWDPCGQYVATIGSDRVCRVYSTSSRRVVARIKKGLLPGAEPESKPTHFFHDDTLKSFFRRLTFTPDGELLVVPSGVVEKPGKTSLNATMVFSRSCLNTPVVYLPSLTQYTVSVRCCPVLFNLREMKSPPMFDLPYRVVIAVATQCSVFLYDTQHAAPFAFITKIHYTRLTDISWSSDGRVLVVSSTDGYCSVITFAENELGTAYKNSAYCEGKQKEELNNSHASNKQKNVQTKKMTEVVSEQPVNTISESQRVTKVVSVGDKIEEKDNYHSRTDPVKPKTTTLGNSEPVEHLIMAESENANMPLFFGDENERKEEQTNQLSEAVSETLMDVDDFQLVYEATVTEPVLDQKDQHFGQSVSTSATFPSELPKSSVDGQGSPPVSPVMITTGVPQEPSVPIVTPGNTNKKAPRRVQLITLSSPKNKNKPL